MAMTGSSLSVSGAGVEDPDLEVGPNHGVQLIPTPGLKVSLGPGVYLSASHLELNPQA